MTAHLKELYSERKKRDVVAKRGPIIGKVVA